MTHTPRHVQRTLLSLLAAGGLVVGGVLSGAPGGDGASSLPSTYDAQARQRAEAVAEREPHTHPGQDASTVVDASFDASLYDGHGHVHDPSTKNAISRSGTPTSRGSRWVR